VGENDQHPLKSKKLTSDIYVATYNARTLRTPEKLIELELALEEIKCDILGICEIRRNGEEIQEHLNYIFYYKGQTSGKYGVGFIVKKKWKKNIIEFIGISERIAILNLNLPNYKNPWSIIQVYSPTEMATEEEKESFYKDLSNSMEETYKNKIIMGDFNSKIGNLQTPVPNTSIIGKYTTGITNNNGQRMINFATENNAAIMNTFYKKRMSKRWTWQSPCGKYRNEIDYILTTSPHAFKNIEVISNFNFNSDHRLLRGTIYGEVTKKTRKHIAKKNNKEIPLPLPETIKDKFVKSIQGLSDGDTTQQKYNKFELALQNLNVDLSCEQRKDKTGDEARSLINQRKELFDNRRSNQKKIAALSKKITHSIKTHRADYRLQMIQKEIEKTGGTKRAIHKLRENTSWIPSLAKKDKEGAKSNTCSRPQISDIATEFFKVLYSANREQYNTTNPNSGINKEEVPHILESETTKAILSQKSYKSAGEDNISNELLKGLIEEINQPMTSLFNDIITTENIPEQWTKSTIILIHKKGDRNKIENYRPISIMSNVYKVFSKILLGRLSKRLDENQPREQAGFRKDFSTIDHIHVVKQLIQKSKEYGITYYLSFVDYTKAFDSLDHQYMWNALREQGVTEKYISIIRKIYEASTAVVQLESKGEQFGIFRGVRQGDPLSPKLFCAVLESIFRKLNWEEHGLNINGNNLNHLRFADDLILFTDNAATLQSMLKQLVVESANAGLTINTTKTKIMTNNVYEPIIVEGEEIEYVQDYVYLGQVISPEQQMLKELERRITNTWRKYWSMKEIMKNKSVPMEIKAKLYNTCLLPCLTYGCETWTCTKKNIQQIAVCQHGMERSMLGIKRNDRWRLTKIREKTMVRDVVKDIRKRKWKWSGHMVRNKIEKWTRQITDWFPIYRKRGRGRQHRRWEDDFPSNWTRLAQDRDTWKTLEEAYVSEN
jgi:exonuclease III